LEKIEGLKFFKLDKENVFYGVIRHDESESEDEKILKNFPKKLWSKNHFSPRLKSRISNCELRN